MSAIEETVKTEIVETLGEPFVPEPLTATEKAVKLRLEAEMRRDIGAFHRFGNNLAQIQHDRLYRDDYPTFEAYIEERWDLSRGHAYRLMKSADVVASLSVDGPAPESERQVRELAKVPEPQRQEVWDDAVSRAEGNQPTAEQVKESAKTARDGAAPSATSDPVHAEPVVPDSSEPTDEEWLAAMSERQKLVGSCREMFDASALAYQSLESARDTYRAASRKVTKPLTRSLGGRVDPWLAKHNLHFRINDPADWKACGECAGTGISVLLKTPCPSCHGHGYHV